MRRNIYGPKHGAGFYGRDADRDGHVCGNCNWQGQGRSDCPGAKKENLKQHEAWRPVRGYESLYEVSDQGQVRSLDRTVPDRAGKRIRSLTGRTLSAATKASGHLAVALSKDGAPVTKHVHRLVAEAFVPGQKDGLEVCHINGDPADNRAGNLRWGTRQSNVDDMIRAGASYWQNMTHCRRGHEYNEVNTRYRAETNERVCRVCKRERERDGRASQSVPYALPDCPASVCDLDDHDECWDDYSRQEDKRKYEKGAL